MPRTQRSRTRSIKFEGTQKTWIGAGPLGPPTSTNVVTITRDSICSDWRGRPISANSFDSTQRSGACLLIGAVHSGTGHYVEFDKVPTVGGSFGPYNSDPIAAPNGWVLSLVASTNPSRPKLTPPELLQNLYELPRMIRNAWKFFQNPRTILTPKGASNEYLGIQFGWRPFINDIMELLDLQDLIDKRLKELNQLHSNKGLRRRRKMGNDNANTVGSATFALPGPNSGVQARLSLSVEKEAWATIRWKPTSAPPYHPQDVRYRDHVRNIVLGLTPEGLAKGLWNVIPWTWLIGWFTNIGSLLLSSSNTVPAAWSEACFMSKVTITTTASGVSPIGTAKPIKLDFVGSATYTRRTRQVGSTSLLPGFNMPMLDMFRLSILSALGIQRFR